MSRTCAALLLLACCVGLMGCTDVRTMRRSRDVIGLVALLQDPDPHVRVKAADALGYVGDSRAVVPLIKALRDEDPYVREHAARNLGCDYHSSLGCDSGEPVRPLIAVLDDDDDFVRVEAARSLGEHPLPAAREPLERLIRNDRQWQVRQAAAFALGRIGSSESIPVLEALLDDEEMQVVRMARQSLRRTAAVRAAARDERRFDVAIDVIGPNDRDAGADAPVDASTGDSAAE